MKRLILSILFLSFSILAQSEELSSKELSGFILIPNISINSFESYDEFDGSAFAYSPSLGIDAEYSKSQTWKFTGKLNYCFVPDWLPAEIGIGIKDIKIFKSFVDMRYYFGVGLNYKMLSYFGSKGEYVYKYPNQLEPPFYYDINNGDLFQAFGAELNYGLNYCINDKFYLDFITGYKAYLDCLSSDFKAVIIRKLSSDSFTTLEGDDNYLNPNSFYVKLGFGVNL